MRPGSLGNTRKPPTLVNAALHSRQTALTNLGLLDPKGEMDQIAREGVTQNG